MLTLKDKLELAKQDQDLRFASSRDALLGVAELVIELPEPIEEFVEKKVKKESKPKAKKAKNEKG
jgi:hypothetical protein